MKYFSFFAISFLFISCKNDVVTEQQPTLEATYKVTVTTTWTSPEFTIPNGAHLTKMIGMVHTADTFLWKKDMPSIPGLEDVAEVGNTDKMEAALDGFLAGKKALSKFSIPPPAINSSVEFPLTFTTTFNTISFASMVAPSPDWFTGLSNYSLLQKNKWITAVTIPLYIYDAGTEDGDVFGYSNPATTPQQNITLLTPQYATVLANGNATLAAIATIKFIKN